MAVEFIVSLPMHTTVYEASPGSDSQTISLCQAQPSILDFVILSLGCSPPVPQISSYLPISIATDQLIHSILESWPQLPKPPFSSVKQFQGLSKWILPPSVLPKLLIPTPSIRPSWTYVIYYSLPPETLSKQECLVPTQSFWAPLYQQPYLRLFLNQTPQFLWHLEVS